jgi:hypothetical protein
MPLPDRDVMILKKLRFVLIKKKDRHFGEGRPFDVAKMFRSAMD